MSETKTERFTVVPADQVPEGCRAEGRLVSLGEGLGFRLATPADEDEIPDDPEELAILICAIAASTPRYRESYTSDLCDALGTDVHSEAYHLAFSAWEDADGRTERTGDEEIDAEAHAMLVEARDREHAAIICGVQASAWADPSGPGSTSFPFTAQAIGAGVAAYELASRALEHAGRCLGSYTPAGVCAEAEALIRAGWNPTE